MIQNIKIHSVKQLEALQAVAARSYADIGVHDEQGKIADAKSMLGLFALDYTKPVRIVCENEKELRRVCRSLVQ